MKRIDEICWVDFVRGVAASEVEREIRGQLAATEEEARRWRRVAALGRKDVEGAIPNEADFVRIVKAMGRRHRSAEAEGWAAPLQRLAVRLVFTSAALPAPMGARSLETPARHLVFETDELVVDVRLERPLDDAPSRPLPGGIVNGQIYRQVGDPQPAPRAPVLVFSGDRVVGSTRCDDSGEFQAENLPAGDLTLCLLVGPEACLEIPLQHE